MVKFTILLLQQLILIISTKNNSFINTALPAPPLPLSPYAQPLPPLLPRHSSRHSSPSSPHPHSPPPLFSPPFISPCFIITKIRIRKRHQPLSPSPQLPSPHCVPSTRPSAAQGTLLSLRALPLLLILLPQSASAAFFFLHLPFSRLLTLWNIQMEVMVGLVL